MIYLASDHGGFKLKDKIKKHLEKEKVNYVDLGPKKYVASDDYPDYAKLVAEKISKKPEQDLGIMLCRSGQGVSIVANKFKNVRAVEVGNVAKAKLAREHVASNVLCLSADFLSPAAAANVVDTWLNTPVGRAERHLRRVKKISVIEQKNFK
jgi:ribose 5-phosphate isomerase B